MVYSRLVPQAFSRLNSRVKDIEERVTKTATPTLEGRIKVAEEMWSGEVSRTFGVTSSLEAGWI